MAEMNYSELFSQETPDLTTVSLHSKIITLHCIARRFLIQQRFNDQCGVMGELLLEKGWVGFGRVQFLMLSYENRLLVDAQHRSERSPGVFIG